MRHNSHISFVKFLKFWFPVILYSGMIFAVSSVPNLRAPMEESNFDKVIHCLEYMILGILVCRVIQSTGLLESRMTFVVVILFCAFYGFSDEFHQLFVMGRDSDWKDLLADSLGGAIGAWIYLIYRKFLQRQKLSSSL